MRDWWTTGAGDKFRELLANSSFAWAIQVGCNNLKPKPKPFNMAYKRKRLKDIQEKVKCNRFTRDKSRVSEILDEIVSGMEPIED